MDSTMASSSFEQAIDDHIAHHVTPETFAPDDATCCDLNQGGSVHKKDDTAGLPPLRENTEI